MKYNVVIIDGGSEQYNKTYVSTVDLIRNSEDSESNDEVNHGALVADVIHKQSPKAKILFLKICKSYNDFVSDDVYRAFDYLLKENIEFDLLNVSLGVQYAEHTIFKSYVDLFVSKGVVIVAANHPHTLSYPALLDNVIGVDVANEITKIEQYVFCKNSPINIIGSNTFMRIKEDKGYTLIKGSSYLAAYISGKISDFLINTQNLVDDKIMATYTFLESNAFCVQENESIMPDYGKHFVENIKKAIVFPFNKEIQQIAANEDLLSFSIDNYYDFDISVNNYKFTDEVTKHATVHRLIRPYKDIDWNSEFDTIICGHCGEYDRLTGRAILTDIIKKCVAYKKNIYCFDQIIGKAPSEINIYSPRINENMFRNDGMKKLYNINKPILGVMGTSSVQGKYSLQLTLRRLFMQKGYKISNIGTEPSGYIFGFDGNVSIGYNSDVHCSSSEFVVYVNDLIKKAEICAPDIIIVGSQSGTAPVINNNVEYLYLRQHEFLVSANPDVVILCVNYFDSCEFIKKTIGYIEGCISGKVIALYVSAIQMPQVGHSMRDKRDIIDDSDLNININRIKEQIEIPIFSMKDNPDILCNYIIDYMS